TAAASGATVALTPADADTNTSGHQITLSEGATTIWAVVTNGGDTGSYSIVVTRAAAADNTAPTVVSIERHNGTDAQAEHTNADTLTFRVTFSEAVENVSTDGSDFDATGTTGDASATAVVTGNDAQYIVTVSGGDLASYDGTVGLAFAAGQDIEDAAKNALTSTTPSGANHTYTVDNTAPTLTVTAPAGHDGSAAFNVTVAFSENVSGFGDVATDVSVTGGTLTDGTNSITGTDAQSYTVNITPSGTANVTVQVIASAATDSAGNGNTASGTVTVTYEATDSTAPTVVSVERDDGAGNDPGEHTNADTLTFRVTFSEAVENVSTDGSDFDATGTTGDATAAAVVTGNDAQYIVTVSGGDLATLDGEVSLTFASGQDIEDADKNDLDATLPTGDDYETYTVDNTRPTVMMMGPTRHDGSTAFVVNIVFSEDMGGTFAGTQDFALTGGSFANGDADITATDGRNYTARITPNGMSEVIVKVGETQARDAAGNGNLAAPDLTVPYGDPSDTTAPTVASIERDDGAGNDPGERTNADSLRFRVTFSEAVQNVDTADFGASGTTATATGVSGSGTTRIVTVGGGDLADLDATVGLTFASGQNIQDLAVNALASTTPSGVNETYTVDNTRPTVMMTGPASHDGSTAFDVSIVFSEDMGGTFAGTLDFAVTGGRFANGDADITATANDGRNYRARITPNGEAEVIVSVGATQATDAAGNGNLAAPDLTVPYADPSDTAAPTVVSIRRDDGARRDPGETTDADTLQFRVLFSKAVTNVDALDFDASGTTGDASAVAAVTGTNAAEYVVTVSNGDLAGYTGTVGLTFDANSLDIQSTAGTALNATLPTGTSYQTYKVNNEVNTVAPTVASIERHDGTKALDVFTRADALTFRVTFSEAVQNVDTADFSASGTTATASGVGVTGSRFVYDVTVMGGNLADLDATVGLTFASGQNIQDLAGNALASTTPTGVNETYTVDNTRPTVTMTGPESHDGTAFDVSVVFSEDVTNFNSPSKLAFTGGKLVNGAADITATDARTYTLRVTPNGVNPVIVRLSANGVGDAAGNGNVAAADLTVPYSVPDTTAPEVVSILRDDGAGNAAFVRTNADTVWFKVTFDEPVVNVDTADFVVRNPTGGTTTTATVTAVTGSGEVYTVTVTGGDLADFEGQVGLGFDSDQDIADAVGNVLVAPTHDYEVYVFDNTAPTVTLARADGLDTTLTAAFNVAVTFTDASFRLQTTGDGALTTDDFNVTNGSATSVTASSHPLRFTAQITPTAGFTGDVLVDLPANSVRDRAGNGNTAAAQLSVPVDVPAASEAPSDGLQARFGPAPAWHTGMAFWTELHFSAGPKLGYRDVRDKIFEVTGADIARAQRLTQGSNAGWRLLVEPDGWGDIALTLPTTTDCAAEGAVCTKEGEPLETGIDLAVPGPGDNLAAWLTGHDTRHTGQAFELELWFNRQPNLGYRDVRDRVFDVDGGTIRRARRLVQGSNLGWRLTVEPDGAGAVTLDLPPTEDCDDEAAVCSRDGDMLQQGIAVTVEGPAAFSVSDAEVTEGSDASLAFEVTLSRTLRAEARVDVATRDGTATAGADYEALAQTLVFAPDETSKTVEVTVLDDAHDEGSETMTLVLSNASGAEIADAEGTGTIVNSDAIPDAWLARFGRTVTGQVLNAVEDRLAAPRHAAMHATLAGQALPLAANETADDLAAASQHAALRTLGARTAATDPSGAPVAWTDRDAPLHLRGRTLSGQDVLTGTAFTLTAPAGAHDGAYVSLWGRGMVSGFGGNDNGLTLDGRVTTSLLGVDWATEGWTAGLSFGHSVGSGGYQGTDCGAGTVACAGAIEASLTGLYPYAG
ncbi:MAG: Ig-like domain-containing protein, partial [bacterium]|nr:Ig-like domain-containing protein [bacterium]